MARPPSGMCLVDGCDEVAAGRGLCKSCHCTATALIGSGQTTWGQLESMGLARPVRKAKFTAAFEAAKSRDGKPLGKPQPKRK